MKLIKKATKVQPQANLQVQIGDRVLVQPEAVHDGRGGWDLPPKIALNVVKVNKFTFDGEDNEGNVFRVDVRVDRFQVALPKAA